MLLKNEFRNIFYRREFWIAILLGLVLAGVSFLEIATQNSGYEKSKIPSPDRASMIWFLSGIGQIYLMVLLPLIASVPYSMCFYNEIKTGYIALSLTRTTKYKYYMSKIALISIVSFCICVIPLIFNQILCLMAFPEKEVVTFFTGSVYSRVNLSLDMERVIFPRLYMNAPLLSNVLQFFMAGIYGACLAVLTFAISLHIRKNFIFNIGIVTIIMLAIPTLTSALQLHFLAVYLNLYAFNYDSNILVFFIFILIISLINIYLIVRHLKCNKDVI